MPVFKTTGKRPEVKYQQLGFESGEWIFRQGDLGTDMYVIQSGSVEIVRHSGDEENIVAILEKGDFFGEMALLEDLPRNASARGGEAGHLLQINGTTFVQMLQDNPEIAIRMMRKLARRLRKAEGLLDIAESSEEAPASGAVSANVAYAEERLVHVPSGMEFGVVEMGDTRVGRKDPVTGIYPEVDLTPVDTQRSISRRHAKLFRRGAQLYLVEEIGTMNGTFVNGERLATGVPREVKVGDEVRIGVVELMLRLE